MAVRSGIKFEQGSGRYDFDAGVFHFEATDDEGRVPCGISDEGFEDLTGERIDTEHPDRQFAKWEQAIFNLARDKYVHGVRQANGTVVIGKGDRLAN